MEEYVRLVHTQSIGERKGSDGIEEYVRLVHTRSIGECKETREVAVMG